MIATTGSVSNVTDLRARIADALMDGVGADELDAYQAADVLLSLSSIAIVDLPKGAVGWASEDWLAIPLSRGRPGIRVSVESPLFPDSARDFAAALLAAANETEQDSK